MTKTLNTEILGAKAETVAKVRPLSAGEVEMVAGGAVGGCIRITIGGPTHDG